MYLPAVSYSLVWLVGGSQRNTEKNQREDNLCSLVHHIDNILAPYPVLAEISIHAVQLLFHVSASDQIPLNSQRRVPLQYLYF